MKTFFQVTASIALATALVPAAEATPGIQNGTINGYESVIVESGSYSAPDFITVFGPNGKEQITVTCAPFNWDSYGANTVSFVDSIARSWCF
jgi:hypothetical protein